MTTNKTYLALLALVSVAFAWVLWPLFGTIFWAVTLVIVFDPLYRRVLVRFGGRRNWAAITMILGILLVVILPTLLLVAAILQEAQALMASIKSGGIDLHLIFQQVLNGVPVWVRDMVLRLGLTDLAALQDSLSASVSDWLGTNAPLVLTIGTNTAGVFVGLGVTLYLAFFLFRDGDGLAAQVKAAIPMPADALEDLLATFTLVVRATVQGDILVALLQGCLGGLAFWVLGIHAAILWTVLMSVLSLFPVFGAAIVWFPVAVWFLSTGAVLEGVGLIAWGAGVISVVDNLARPWLVGKATRIPDFIVLMSTIGGIASFGLQGFITGPVVAAMFIAVWTTFLSRQKV